MSDYVDEIAPFTSDDWERMRKIVLKNRIGHLGLNPAPIKAAAQFQASMLRLQEPLLLPENRTEETQQSLLSWLGLTTQTEARCIGAQADENGVEHEAWQYTMTPCYWESPPPDPEVRRYRRELRVRKLKRRQRRAAQRRHNRGIR